MAFRSFPLGVFLIAAILAGPALAAPKRHVAVTTAPAPSAEATTVDELSVQPTAKCLEPLKDPRAPPPRIVSTFPARGAVVRPGVLVVRVTFDQPMSCKGFFAPAIEMRTPCPEETQYWVLSFDRRTIRTTCRTEVNSHYGLRLSDRSLSGDSKTTFVSLAGQRAPPYVLTFDTSAEAPITTAGESLAEDPEMREPQKDVPLKLQGDYVKR
ncbi:MAG TPA: hypothetical protein VHN39_14975 [Phenylobacterium sp.]|nr:hypothetical protein [Phenylobacterium sp.]